MEIFSKQTKAFLICVLYRPPDSSKHLHKNFNEKLENFLSTITHENKELIIIMGDINCNYLDKKVGKPLKELLSLHGLIQIIKGPTRITGTTESLIDVILSTKPEYLDEVKVIQTAISDHDTIGCKRKINNIKVPYEVIKCRDYSNYNPADLSRDLAEEDWENNVYVVKDPNTAWNNLKEILTNNISRHVPFITKKVKGKSPWLTREMKIEMNYRDTLQRKFRKSKNTIDYENFRRQRNKVNILLRKAKNNHIQIGFCSFCFEHRNQTQVSNNPVKEFCLVKT